MRGSEQSQESRPDTGKIAGGPSIRCISDSGIRVQDKNTRGYQPSEIREDRMRIDGEGVAPTYPK